MQFIGKRRAIMSKTIRIAVVGYGNVGRFAVETVQATPDMELIGLVNNPPPGEKTPVLPRDITVVDRIDKLTGVQVALLCIPSRAVPDYAPDILEKGINTVDSFDIHAQIVQLRRKLDLVAKAHQTVAVLSSGWDPGTDSMMRCIFEFMTPRGITYTDFGPGMSMGHSVAAKAVPGVDNALSMTIPLGTGVHRRMVYVEMADGCDFDSVRNTILNDPYFINDETHVFQVADVNRLIDIGHGVQMQRKGVSGLTHNQLLKMEMRINNPALTAQIMVASARASVKQAPGAYTMIQIPIVDYLYGDEEEIIGRLV